MDRVPESFATLLFGGYSGTRPSRVTAKSRVTREACIEGYKKIFTLRGICEQLHPWWWN